ncbi:MAG: DUF1657 domain-containing protein [Firmicutes bacterium]|nr:DUF1657 domain-containing protein [Bacillota bacterium]
MTVASQVKQTLTSLQNAQATLGIYAIQSAPQEAKRVFEEARRIVGEITSDIEKRIKNLEFEEPQYKGL